jgi:hypothetical protein
VPVPIRDQADMLGCDRDRLLVQLWQAEFLARNGLHHRATGKTVRAYVSVNRWVADCECGGGIMVSRWNPECCCLDCGRVYAPEFPADVDAGEKVLLDRPDPDTRHWLLGEPVAKLEAENDDMMGVGVSHTTPTDAPSHLLLVPGASEVDDGLADDALHILGTGYVIRRDTEKGESEVEAVGHTDEKVAAFAKTVGATS